MRVILAVTGCIAAYKSALILRLLQEKGLDVQPVMTRSATQFIGPLTLEKLSGNRVVDDLFASSTTDIEHISLARSSQLMLVAPATANILAKFAQGIADDFLSTLYLSTTSPVVVAPAMNVEMWRHRATRDNLSLLRSRGVVVVEPGIGYQACGEVGPGRLAEVDKIVEVVVSHLGKGSTLQAKSVLVTAGPTIEDIDPVRFVSNRSSGKMGYAIAEEAARRGARVWLVSGPTQLSPPPGVEVVPVRSAAEMADAALGFFDEADIVVKAAAVMDFTPAQMAEHKIKKRAASGVLELKPTVDILERMGRRKEPGQILVGFAAESEQLLENAREKLRKKNLDLIVANDIARTDSGFAVDTSQVVLIDGKGAVRRLEKLFKSELAKILWEHIEGLIKDSAPSVPAPSEAGKSG